MRAVFITEGKKEIGFGHVTRCLGIAQAFKEKNIQTLLIVNGDDSILQLLKKENFKIIDWIKSEEKLFKIIKKNDIVFVDSYLANKKFYKKISILAKQVIYIDDNNRLPYPKGIIVNGNIHGTSVNYRRKKEIQYLLGSKYAPIRKEFWNTSSNKINKKIGNVLITFGGDDKRNLTPKVLSLLQNNYPEFYFSVIIGSGFMNKKQILTAKTNKTKIFIEPDPKLIKKLMMKSDLAVSASGQTTLELLRLRIPTVIITVADNQKNIANYLVKKDLAEFAGDWKARLLKKNIIMSLKNLESYRARKKMSKLQQKLVDGQGSHRVVDFILKKIPKKILFLTNNQDSIDLAAWLKNKQEEDVVIFSERLSRLIISKIKPDFLISYNYKYIIKEDVLRMFEKGTALNLHISYLPWNRGSNPNFWSFVYNSPKGVTIHAIDKEVDTGDILIQKKILFDTKNETLKTTYKKLNILIQRLFKENWKKIKLSEIKLKKQTNGGSFHTIEEFDKIKHLLNKDRWNTPIRKLII